MIASIQKSLSDLNINNGSLNDLINENLSPDFIQLICQLTYEIKELRLLDESVNKPTNEDDILSFHLELGSFLKEINCPYDSLTQSPISCRLTNESQKLLLIDFLITELMTARILEKSRKNKSNEMNIKIYESPTASDLSKIAKTLSIDDKQKNLNSKMLFEQIIQIISNVSNIKNLVSESLFYKLNQMSMSKDDWKKLEKFQIQLHKDFRNRRQLLIKRLEVTVQSFLWSDRLKAQESKINELFKKRKNALEYEPKISIIDLLNARSDLLIIEKTSSNNIQSNTKPFIYKHIIGPVPDRGGRTSEQAPPEPEMPSWQTQRSTGPAQQSQWQPKIQSQSQWQQQPQFQQRGGEGRGRGGFYNQQQQQQAQLPFFQPPQRVDYANQYAQDSISHRQQMDYNRRGSGRNDFNNRSYGASNPKRGRSNNYY